LVVTGRVRVPELLNALWAKEKHMMLDDTSKSLAVIAEKIRNGLKKKGSGCDGEFSLGFFLCRTLEPQELEWLDEYGDSVGAEKANEWLCGILVSSGMYVQDGPGNVRAVL
jgi:hypothetical protein